MGLQQFRTFLLVLAFLGLGTLVFFVYQGEKQKQSLKKDLVELSMVKYGLFSVDEWKIITAQIITKRVSEFNLDGGNRAVMREKIQGLLQTVIGDLEQHYDRENRGSIKGFFKRKSASVLGVFGSMKRDIPQMTERILEFLDDPQNREAIRKYIIGKLQEYADKTFAEIDYTEHNAILARHGMSDRSAAQDFLQSSLSLLQQQQAPFQKVLFALVFLLALLLLLARKLSKLDFLLLTLCSFILLLSGIILPMIDIDARIAELRFSLLGEPVSFTDQILYFNSKSILQVVELMLTQGKIDLLMVGCLVLAFSVLFPLAKLVASVVVLYQSTPPGRLLHFLAFRTGKWSMADVMVIAIFMAYIGFTGIISEQLKQIEGLTEKIDILTTNESSLQVGFFLFTAFTILSLLVSHRLKKARETVI